jgi:hypothetical protein
MSSVNAHVLSWSDRHWEAGRQAVDNGQAVAIQTLSSYTAIVTRRAFAWGQTLAQLQSDRQLCAQLKVIVIGR